MWTIYTVNIHRPAIRFTCLKPSRNSNYSIVTGCTSRYRNIEDHLLCTSVVRSMLSGWYCASTGVSQPMQATWLLRQESAVGEWTAVRMTHFLNESWLILPTYFSRICRIGLTLTKAWWSALTRKHSLPKLLIYRSETFLLQWFTSIVTNYSQQSVCLLTTENCIVMRCDCVYSLIVLFYLGDFYHFFYSAIIYIFCLLSDAAASDTGHIKGYLCVCVCVCVCVRVRGV